MSNHIQRNFILVELLSHVTVLMNITQYLKQLHNSISHLLQLFLTLNPSSLHI